MTKIVLANTDPAEVEAMKEILQRLRAIGERIDGTDGLKVDLENGETIEVTKQDGGERYAVVVITKKGQ